jgi:fluoride ion exporter CrcB/FEX
MNSPHSEAHPSGPPAGVPNGPGAAALLAASLGCFLLAILAFAGDKSPAVKSAMTLYKPTGPLSGVTTIAVLAWLALWAILEWRWGSRTVAIGGVIVVAFLLLALSFLLTFPPVVDVL